MNYPNLLQVPQRTVCFIVPELLACLYVCRLSSCGSATFSKRVFYENVNPQSPQSDSKCISFGVSCLWEVLKGQIAAAHASYSRLCCTLGLGSWGCGFQQKFFGISLNCVQYWLYFELLQFRFIDCWSTHSTLTWWPCDSLRGLYIERREKPANRTNQRRSTAWHWVHRFWSFARFITVASPIAEVYC